MYLNITSGVTGLAHFAKHQRVSMDTGLSLLKLVKSQANWNKLLILKIISQVKVALHVGKSEPLDNFLH